ncbi:hypothetical protein ACWJJH_13925 [Endozoicomonadaceae bacterium StTr2]
MKKISFASFLTLCVLLLTACSSAPPLPNAKASWTIYPFYSHVENDEATDQVQRMLTVLAPAQGIKNLELPPTTEVSSTTYLLSQAHRIQNSRQWAEQHQVKYAFGGTIDRWEINDDGKPVVALTLDVLNVADNSKLVSTTSSSEGKPGDDLYEQSRILLRQMLQSLPIIQ